MISAASAKKVEIVLDPACVWSYLAYTRFTRVALRYRAGGGLLEVTFRPFQVDPDAPVAGEPLRDVLGRQFGAAADERKSALTALAAREGIEVDFENSLHTNTFDANRLIAQAAGQDLGEQMVARLFRAYQVEGLNVADLNTLAKLATEVGVTMTDGGAGELRAELGRVRRSGIAGVPVFVFEGGSTLSGAQSEDNLSEALDNAP